MCMAVFIDGTQLTQNVNGSIELFVFFLYISL